jgi:hypothetical protein
VRETRQHVAPSRSSRRAASGGSRQREVFWRTTLFDDRDLSSVSQAGLVNNLNDGMAWGLFPLFFAAAGAWTSAQIGTLAAIYPATWGVTSSSPARGPIASGASG